MSSSTTCRSGLRTVEYHKDFMKNKHVSSRRLSYGFTIVELLIVIVVIAILAAVSIVGYNAVRVRAVDSANSTTVSEVLKAVGVEHAKTGTYGADMFMANGGFRGGSLEPSEVARLLSAGIDPKLMHHPASPSAIASSFVFNAYNYDSESKLSDSPADTTVAIYVPRDPPSGYGNWGEFWDELWVTYDEFYEDWEQSHPYPETWEEQDAWYQDFDVAFAQAYPDFAYVYNNGTNTRYDVPKEAVYIVDVLGAPAPNNGSCTQSSLDDGSYTVRCSADFNDENRIVEATGIRITYFNRASSSWTSRQIGSGHAFGHYYYGDN